MTASLSSVGSGSRLARTSTGRPDRRLAGRARPQLVDLWSTVRSEYLSMETVAVRSATGFLPPHVQVRRLTSAPGASADRNERILTHLPLTMAVLDRTTALLPLDLRNLVGGFVTITEPVVVRALTAVHEELWNAAGDDAEGPPVHLSAILPLLATGLRDDSAARRVGLSHRTYGRRVADLLKVLGARSRFGAGVEAARRGWL